MGIKSDNKGPSWHTNYPKVVGEGPQFDTVPAKSTYLRDILSGVSGIIDKFENPEDQTFCIEVNLQSLKDWEINIGEETLLQLARSFLNIQIYLAINCLE